MKMIKFLHVSLFVACFASQFCFGSDMNYSNLITRAVKKIQAQDPQFRQELDAKLQTALDVLEKKLINHQSNENQCCDVEIKKILKEVISTINEYGEVYGNVDSKIEASYRLACNDMKRDLNNPFINASFYMVADAYYKNIKKFLEDIRS